MKFSCDKYVLQQAAASAARAAAAKSPIPTLEGLLIEAGASVRITGYDLKKAIYTTIDADIPEPGSVLIGARLFCEMLRRGGELDGHRVIGPRTLAMMHMNHLAGGKDLTQMAIGSFSETSNEGVGFGLGFASTMDEVSTGSLGAGDYYWGGAASTIFLVDPKEDLTMVFMTQLMPSGTFNFRGQLKSLIYSAIID